MELLRFPSRGGFSVRSVFIFVLTVVITALLWATLSSTPSYAVREGETATWQNGGQTLIFDRHTYNTTNQLNDSSGTIPSGATIYQSPVQNGTQSPSDKKVFVIYFSPGVDPPTATSATYVEFSYNNNSTISNPQNKRDIPVELPRADGESGSSCSVTGVGWIICPASTFLAEAMDKMFEILSGFIAVQPSVLGDPNNSMYVAWNVMRNIANIAFVIAFLIIIYSQLTSFGVSNYGIKKLIPRLVISAVLVNISFIVTALAVDISNILGYSIQEVFNTIREQTFHLSNDNLSGLNTNVWGALTAAVLAGGGLVGGVYYLATGGLYLLLPLLVGLGLTVMFVIIILAARQAIIIILVIIAPLAFVANLLPNTEKWFDKWKDLFMTMLIFFPAFSLVFGGSQLAGQIIIQNAGGDILTLIFGLAVQIAPLVITPLILKLSGSLLGRIAQIANNPRRGIIDRTRNWGEARAEHAKYQNIKRGARFRNPSSWGAGMVRRADQRKRRLTDNTDIWKQEATNLYEQSEKYAGKNGIHERKAGADLDKNAIHNRNEAHIEKLKTTQGTRIYNSAMDVQTSEDKLKTRQQDTAGYYNMLRTVGGTDLNESNNALQAATSNASASEQNKEAYLNQMRTFRSTQLGAAAERLEAAKLNAEGMQSKYTAHIDDLKLAPNSTLGNATVFAQSSKEHAESAQTRVQAMFERERREVGSSLNVSSTELERVKMNVEAEKAYTTEFFNREKATAGTDLHLEKIRSEQAKLASQVSETALDRVVKEYKSGRIIRSGELSDLMTNMVDDIENLAAESQGAQAAENIQKKNIAEAFTADTQRSQDLLTTARSVDQFGDVRAKASALATLNEIRSKTRSVNEALLEEMAVDSNMTPKDYAKALVERRLGGDTSETEDVIQAAMEIMGKEAQIPIIRQMRMSDNFNQGHLAAMLLRNSGTMKQKGGFDLQNDPSLANASEETMLASMARNTGSTSPEDLPGLKLAAAYDFANNTDKMLSNAVGLAASSDAGEAKSGTEGLIGLETAYANLTTALSDPEIRRKMGDNLLPSIKMHMKLHRHFQKSENEIDYDEISPIALPANYANDEAPGDSYRV